MKETRSRLLLIAGLMLVVGLPLAGWWARRQAPPRCSLDGLAIEPLYRVRVVDQEGGSHLFCCVRCAVRWLSRQPERPAGIYVTDEVSREEIDAASACFVESAVVTNPVTGNRTHVFRSQADAEEHARLYAGWHVTGTERPF
jgi:hypothetical protein